MKILNDIGLLLVGISVGIYFAISFNPPFVKYPLFPIAFIFGLAGTSLLMIYRSSKKKIDWFGNDKTKTNFPI